MRRHALTYRTFGMPLETLKMETSDVPGLSEDKLRVRMLYAPVNPSDLIPITGAYSHRVRLPAVAGYEGVGCVIDAPQEYSNLIGKRVLPLRGDGTWQTIVECDPALAVPVPDTISDDVAARAYINPLAALTMLETWPVKGKRVLLTGAGSNCAEFLGVWAYQQGAKEVIGIYRSESRVARLEKLGIEPVSIQNMSQISSVARESDIVFDALGGPVAANILQRIAPGTRFIAYGLLTGQAIQLASKLGAHYKRFHLRDSLARMSAQTWQHKFSAIWSLLGQTELPNYQVFPSQEWRQAIEMTLCPSSQKVILDFADLAPHDK
ncbi:zinc-dependent alcohol dehydrogenase family protein [Halomonas sp. SpR1]|uniref:zinc-dependent alcohol dehydrogenase family protein n=1 Tax=Halomonas sp. SpR1 TaxID=3050462 RepID=UPI0027E4060B|nr:zinc-dependent alcohol dehydrogenase family protein [Halomonas sp. SpR1]MDQ7731913.1 zinc-dependent alcohol dehydrogenase family protein [Halomonas sp. SpR1]